MLSILRATLLAILTLTFKCSIKSLTIFNQMPINSTCFLAQNLKLTDIFQIKALHVKLGVYIEGLLCLDCHIERPDKKDLVRNCLPCSK